jgi:hypothetical protein
MIGRLKPPLDFYFAYGSWIVRYYPKHINQPGTPPQQKTWDAMLETVDDWNAMKNVDQVAWTVLVRNAMRTGKDFFYRCRLTRATKTPYIWHTISLINFFWSATFIGVITKRSSKKLWRLYYCNQDGQHKTFYWKDEGYCIRGRRMSVKRNLIEQWENYVDTWPFCFPGYTCFRIPITEKDKVIFVNFRRSGISTIADHGRTGVYITRRP